MQIPLEEMQEKSCKATTKNGTQCRAAATSGGLCFFHANPNKASELGRIGGQKNRRAIIAETAEPLPRLNSATAVREVVARLVDDIYSRKLDPRIGSGLAPLLNLQLRAIESSDLERRIAILENRWMNKQDDSNNQHHARTGSEYRLARDSSEATTNSERASTINGANQ